MVKANCGAGGNQNIMEVLEEVLRQEPPASVAGPIWDAGAVAQMNNAGIDPARKRDLLIKSWQQWRAGFEPIATAIVLGAGPGACRSDYGLFPFEKLKRPLYPLEPETEFLDK